MKGEESEKRPKGDKCISTKIYSAVFLHTKEISSDTVEKLSKNYWTWHSALESSHGKLILAEFPTSEYMIKAEITEGEDNKTIPCVDTALLQVNNNNSFMSLFHSKGNGMHVCLWLMTFWEKTERQWFQCCIRCFRDGS